MGENQMAALMAAQAAVDAISGVCGVITPFPGGIVASGSKVGSKKYKFMGASTNEVYCPTLRDKVEGSKVPEGVKAVYEIVIDGVDGTDEFGWPGAELHIGDVVIALDSRRGRCPMTTVDPDTLEVDRGVLKDIIARFDGKLALNAEVLVPGTIRIGDPVDLVR